MDSGSGSNGLGRSFGFEGEVGFRITAAEVDDFHSSSSKAGWNRPPLSRLRYQIPLVIIVLGILPALPFVDQHVLEMTSGSSLSNSLLGTFVCAIWSLLLFRRLGSFPGVTSFGQVIPAIAIPYMTTLLTFFLLRLDYSRPLFLMSVVAAIILFSALWVYYRRACAPTVYVLPGTSLARDRNLHVRMLDHPVAEFGPNSIVAANLRADYPPIWERFLLRAALMGIPVFHGKLLQESVTGRVEIEHLSENTFGSVIPSNAYLKVKRVVDLFAATALLILLLLPAILVAGAIKWSSPGGIFFVQERMGFRGKRFRMIKFRTMRSLQAPSLCARTEAMTRSDDDRITKIGRFLRRTRMDELPQLINVLRGEMSLIGPRPEAGALSDWYHDSIPFYAYRHMVRPGITGWAQVNQGHVTDVHDVREKLHYDFYYIKYFSAWLDALIALRTVKTIAGGFGAR